MSGSSGNSKKEFYFFQAVYFHFHVCHVLRNMYYVTYFIYSIFENIFICTLAVHKNKFYSETYFIVSVILSERDCNLRFG